MKLQLMQMNLYNRSESTINPPVEVNTLEEAVRMSFFTSEATQEEVNEFLQEFEEKDNMFISNGEELCIIFFKV